MKERIRNKIISISHNRIVKAILFLLLFSLIIVGTFFPAKFTIEVQFIWISANILLMAFCIITKTNADVLEKNKLITILLSNEFMVITLSLMMICVVYIITNVQQWGVFPVIVIITVSVVWWRVYKYFQKKVIY